MQGPGPSPGVIVIGLTPTLQPAYYGAAAIPRTFGDGTSNTIGFATGYMNCPPDPSNTSVRYYYNTLSFFGQTTMNQPATQYGPPQGQGGANGNIFQTQPLNANCDSSLPQAMSITGISVAMFDGHVTMQTGSISPQTWAQAATPNDGQVLGQPGNDWNW